MEASEHHRTRHARRRVEVARALIESVWATGSIPIEHFTHWGSVAGTAARLHPAGRHLTNAEYRDAIVELVDIGWLESARRGRGGALAVRPSGHFVHRELPAIPDVEVRPRHNRRRIVDEARAAQRLWVERQNGLCPATSEFVMAARAMPRQERGVFPMPLTVAMERASRRAESVTGLFNKQAVVGAGKSGSNGRYGVGLDALIDHGYVERVKFGRYRLVQPYRVVPAYIPAPGEQPWWECIVVDDRYANVARHGLTRAQVLGREDGYLAQMRRERNRRIADVGN